MQPLRLVVVFNCAGLHDVSDGEAADSPRSCNTPGKSQSYDVIWTCAEELIATDFTVRVRHMQGLMCLEWVIMLNAALRCHPQRGARPRTSWRACAACRVGVLRMVRKPYMPPSNTAAQRGTQP